MQGEVLRIDTTAPGKLRARLDDKIVPLYPQAEGSAGLVPAPVDAKPGPHEVAVIDEAGKTIHSATVEIANARYRVQNIAATSTMKALTALPGEMETMKAFYELETPAKSWTEPFLAPVPDCRNSSFGVTRYHNGKPSGGYHRGLDLRSPPGRPVKAGAAGRVVVSREWRRHGGTIGIDHAQGVTSHYLHLSKLAATEGQQVQAGDIVGYVHGVPVNPERFTRGIPLCAPPPAPKRAIKK